MKGEVKLKILLLGIIMIAISVGFLAVQSLKGETPEDKWIYVGGGYIGENESFTLTGGYNVTYIGGSNYVAPWAERSFCYIAVHKGNDYEMIPVINYTIVDNFKIVFSNIAQTGKGSSQVDVWRYNVDAYGDYWGRE